MNARYCSRFFKFGPRARWDGPMFRIRRRVGPLILTHMPSWMLAGALMPVARSDESFRVVRRLVQLWRQSHPNKRLVAAKGPEPSTADAQFETGGARSLRDRDSCFGGSLK